VEAARERGDRGDLFGEWALPPSSKIRLRACTGLADELVFLLPGERVAGGEAMEEAGAAGSLVAAGTVGDVVRVEFIPGMLT